jgi:hypothetical protein
VMLFLVPSRKRRPRCLGVVTVKGKPRMCAGVPKDGELCPKCVQRLMSERIGPRRAS